MRIKSVYKPGPVAKGLLHAVQCGAKVFGMAKGAYDTYKTVSAAVQTAAPYVRTLAALV